MSLHLFLDIQRATDQILAHSVLRWSFMLQKWHDVLKSFLQLLRFHHHILPGVSPCIAFIRLWAEHNVLQMGCILHLTGR